MAVAKNSVLPPPIAKLISDPSATVFTAVGVQESTSPTADPASVIVIVPSVTADPLILVLIVASPVSNEAPAKSDHILIIVPATGDANLHIVDPDSNEGIFSVK